MLRTRFFNMGLVLLSIYLCASQDVQAQDIKGIVAAIRDLPCCEYEEVPGYLWSGNKQKMTLAEIAAIAAPILWFSPDEPLLMDLEGKDIRIPEAFPFEESPDAPVVYYRIRTVLKAGNQAETFVADENDKGKGVVDLSKTLGFEIDYFFYYHAEEGLGGHAHDVEYVEMKIGLWERRDMCNDCQYAMLVTKVIGKAHGLLWYDNTLQVDKYTRFPMTLLVEEGKHASCTDKNGDGYYTPGYDVNKRVNDAWGVRDVIRSGALFTGGYQAWMAKVRWPEHRVFPPLPADSPLRAHYTDETGVYSPDNSIYELRPWPTDEKADHDLKHFISDKGDPVWPREEEITGLDRFANFLETESFIKSLSIMYRYDGDHGIAFVFPLLIIKNVEEPLAGGFLLNRIYLKDKDLRDFSWNVLYTPSASRWIDSYLSAGVEVDKFDTTDDQGMPVVRSSTDFVLETGLKFRVNMTHSPLKFLTKLTDFWGFRFGIRNRGMVDISQLSYVFEVGAGTW